MNREFFQENIMQQYLRSSLAIRSLAHLIVLAVVWLILTEGISESWFFGLPVIILAVILVAGDKEEGSNISMSFSGIMTFIPFFLWQSVMSGFDVAIRSLRLDMGLRPVLLNYPMSLPNGAPRRLFVNSITLMPGTLSVQMQDDSVIVHALDERQPVMAALQHLEARVGAVFGVTGRGKGSS